MTDTSELIKEGSKAFLTFFFDILETVVIAFAIFAVVYIFIASPHEVIGRSMEPNFHEGEFLLADKLSYRFREPKRGEVVIFQFDDTHDYIKRVVGLPGDEIEIHDGYVYVNGKKIPESEYLDTAVRTANGNYLTPGRKEIIPEGHVFAMGDNRPHSSDSRNFGMVAEDKIKGRAIFRYWPFDKVTIVPKTTYGAE